MPSYPYTARRLMPLAALAAMSALVLAGCSDRQLPTDASGMRPSFTQVASAPVVNSLADPGDGTCDDVECTLREAIELASSGGTITFSVTGTISTAATLGVAKELTINGPAAASLTIQGNGTEPVVSIAAVAATIRGITISGGNGGTTYGAFGGGILSRGTLLLEDCLISGNTAGAGSGGGAANDGGALTIRRCTFSGNTAPNGAGGAIYSRNGSLTITASRITGNTAGTGGGIDISQTSGSIEDSWVTSNQARFAGGMNLYSTSPSFSIVGTTISANQATQYDGGGVRITGTADPVLKLINSTVSGNGAAEVGGGLYNGGGRTWISHSTVTGNTAITNYDGGGAGIYANDGRVVLVASIVAGNTLSSEPDDIAVGSGGITSQDYNLVGVSSVTAFTGTHDQVGADPKLGALADNGGATQTHALLSGSPAIDLGTCTDIGGATLSTDQRGVSRPQGSACDIGAFEMEPQSTTTPNFTFDLSELPAKTFGE